MLAIPFTPSLISSISRRSSKSKRDAKHSSPPSGSATLVAPSSITSVRDDENNLKLAVETDLAVIQRQPSSSRSSSTRSSPSERPADTLSVMLADDLRVRRSKCAAEFLEGLVTAGPQAVEALSNEMGRRMKLVAGLEAVGLYKKFLGSHVIAEDDDEKPEQQGERSSPMVFAIPVWDAAGRKLVDYYMTWKGKTRVNDIKDRKRSFLDSEFRKVARSIDKQFRHASVYGSSAAPSLAASTMSSKENAEVDAPLPTLQEVDPPSRPPNISIPPAAMDVDLNQTPAPVSASASVVSIPYLGMVRNVPPSHRLPLRIANPDRLSMLSNIGSVQELEPQVMQKPTTSLPTVKEHDEGQRIHGAENALTSVSDENRPQMVEVVKASGASIRSAHSVTTVSSASIKSSRRKSTRHSTKNSTEFVIVLLDDKLDKNLRTWHGLERQVSRSSTHSTPTRRVSPWDGPLARDNGITYRTGPIKPSPSRGKAGDDQGSSTEEEWENAPVIPFVVKPYAPSIASSASSSSSELYTPPMGAPVQLQHTPASHQVQLQHTPHQGVPVQLQHTPQQAQYALGMMTPAMQGGGGRTLPYPYGSQPPSQPSSSYLGSSYTPPYHSPVIPSGMPLLKPLGRASYMGYQSPYIP